MVLVDEATCLVVQRVLDDGRVVGGIRVVAAESLVARVIMALAFGAAVADAAATITSFEVILLSARVVAAWAISAHLEEGVCRADAVGLHEIAPICTCSRRSGVMGFSCCLESCSRRFRYGANGGQRAAKRLMTALMVSV
jgi:hypothetical protein